MVFRVHRYPMLTSPFDTLLDFEREIDGLFGTFLNRGALPYSRVHPALDIAGYENESVVLAEVPGVRKEDIRISLQDGVLTISGERKGVTLPEDGGWVRNEIRTGQFSRTLQVPHDVDAGKISAELTNGVLRVVLPKAERARPREIKVH